MIVTQDSGSGIVWNTALISSLNAPEMIEVLSDDSGESQAVVKYLTDRSVRFREIHVPGRAAERPVLIYSEDGLTTRLQGTSEIAAFLHQKQV